MQCSLTGELGALTNQRRDLGRLTYTWFNHKSISYQTGAVVTLIHCKKCVF